MIAETLAPARPGHGRLAGDPVEDCQWRAIAIARRTGRRFVGLRNRTLDPRLFAYIPPALAEREGVIALEVAEDTLTLASARSEPDLGPLLHRFPNLRIDLVVAREDEIAAALARTDRRRG